MGVSQNDAQAAAWYRAAAEQGHPWAQCNLGFQYYDGHGVTQSYAEAADWFRKAAEQGDRVAQGMLGEMYRDGLGVPQDGAQAASWDRKAAEQGADQDHHRYTVRSYNDGEIQWGLAASSLKPVNQRQSDGPVEIDQSAGREPHEQRNVVERR